MNQANKQRRGSVKVTYPDGRVEWRPTGFFRKNRRRTPAKIWVTPRKGEYQRHWYLRTEHWPQVRLQAKIRDGFRCVKCGCGGRLHVHHKTYDRKGVEWLEDLETLCGDCHERAHR